jgi:hypothetical protein
VSGEAQQQRQRPYYRKIIERQLKMKSFPHYKQLVNKSLLILKDTSQKIHLCSSSSALLDEKTMSRDGSCNIHSTLETGRQEKRKVDGCMWKYTMTSTGKEAYT